MGEAWQTEGGGATRETRLARGEAGGWLLPGAKRWRAELLRRRIADIRRLLERGAPFRASPGGRFSARGASGWRRRDHYPRRLAVSPPHRKIDSPWSACSKRRPPEPSRAPASYANTLRRPRGGARGGFRQKPADPTGPKPTPARSSASPDSQKPESQLDVILEACIFFKASWQRTITRRSAKHPNEKWPEIIRYNRLPRNEKLMLRPDFLDHAHHRRPFQGVTKPAARATFPPWRLH
jgi:hypothetical protein